jgi:hypothetical protein
VILSNLRDAELHGGLAYTVIQQQLADAAHELEYGVTRPGDPLPGQPRQAFKAIDTAAEARLHQAQQSIGVIAGGPIVGGTYAAARDLGLDENSAANLASAVANVAVGSSVKDPVRTEIAPTGGTVREPVILDLFGGETSQTPGAINVDTTSVQGLRASATKLPFGDGVADEIVADGPYLKGPNRTIMDYLPEAARVLKTDGQLIINSTAGNKFGNLPPVDTLSELGLEVIVDRGPLLDRFSANTFRRTDGTEIPSVPCARRFCRRSGLNEPGYPRVLRSVALHGKQSRQGSGERRYVAHSGQRPAGLARPSLRRRDRSVDRHSGVQGGGELQAQGH